jgi:hypothetical protein
VAAFANLYGLVKFFHPSDAASSIDWNRFAVLGVHDLRGIHTGEELQKKLRALFEPVVVGLDIADKGEAFGPWKVSACPADDSIAWRHMGLGSAVGGNVEKVSYGPEGPLYVSWRTHRDPRPDRVSGAQLTGPNVSCRSTQPFELALAYGLKARVPLVLSDETAKITRLQHQLLRSLSRRLATLSVSEDSLETRLADSVVAWNVYRHFYPLLDQARVNWDAFLRTSLEMSEKCFGRQEHYDLLRRLIAQTNDGHGLVMDTTSREMFAYLPLAIEPIGGGWVVTGTSDPKQVRIGDIVQEIDGVSTSIVKAHDEALVSGSPQHRIWRAASIFPLGVRGTSVQLMLQRNANYIPRLQYNLESLDSTKESLANSPGKMGIKSVRLAHSGRIVPEQRPGSPSEIRASIWYIDLTRTSADAVIALLPKLTEAKAIIFDVRGYPKPGMATVLAHMLARDEHETWMHVPIFSLPFQRSTQFFDVGWDLRAESPHLNAAVFFLTDGRAISYAESVMSYVADEHLGTIVGSETAGANGDINTFSIPGGFTIVFTGMKVTRHNGNPLHVVGIEPDIPVVRTVAGVIAGRDEVLERALECAQKLRMAGCTRQKTFK